MIKLKSSKSKGLKLTIGKAPNGVQVKRSQLKQTIILGGIAYALFVLLILHSCAYMTLDYQMDFVEAIVKAGDAIKVHPFQFVAIPYGCTSYIILMTAIYGLAILYMYAEVKKDEHMMSNAAYGTARFNADLESYNKDYTDCQEKLDTPGSQNLIITNDVYLSMDDRKTRRNCNTVIIGGSGAGKSRFYIKPNLCQMPLNCNFVTTDPSGEILESTGTMLEAYGYKIKVLNLVNMNKSNTYNPLEYIECENDVILLVDCILANTADQNRTGGDEFWDKAMKLMLQSFVFLLWLHGEEIGYSKTFDSIMRLMRGCTISEDAAALTDLSDTDKLFNMIEYGYKEENGKVIAGSKLTEGNPDYIKAYGEDIAVRQYKNFKMGAGKTLKNILISAMARFSNFDSQQLIDLTSSNDIELDRIGNEKTALFVILPQEHDSFNFLAAVMYSQLFQALYFHAENECQGNYIVQDKNGENVKIFSVNHGEVISKHDAETVEEVEIDLTNDIRKQSSVFNNLFAKIKAGSCKIKKGSSEKEENKIWGDEAAENEEKTLPDESVGNYNDKNIEAEAQQYVESLKNCRLVKLNDKYLIKASINDTEEIIAEYKDKDYAIKRAKAIKESKIVRCGLYLPYRVRFLLDEFANIGQIPRFTNLLATMRKYKISCAIVLQSISQIKKMYKDDWGSIIGNCDSFLFLGCPEYDTLEYVSKKLGKTTIVVKNNSISRGGKRSSSMSYQHVARDLMAPDELGQMKDDECILLIRGVYPFRGKKYDYEKHPNYGYTGDANRNNIYKLRIEKKEEAATQKKNISVISYAESVDKKEPMNRGKGFPANSSRSQFQKSAGKRCEGGNSRTSSNRQEAGIIDAMKMLSESVGITVKNSEERVNCIKKTRMATAKDVEEMFASSTKIKKEDFLTLFAESSIEEEQKSEIDADNIIQSAPSASSSIEVL